MVLMIILKQALTPASDCLNDINDWNEKVTTAADDGNDNNGGGGGGGFFNRKKNNAIVDVVDESIFIGKWEAVKYCTDESVMEILSVLCCLSLIWLMYQPVQGDDFTSLPFRLAVSFVPLIISSYFNNPVVGSLTDLTMNGGDIDGSSSSDTVEPIPRSFPVVLIFLFVGFTSLYMMKYQQNQQDENIEKIEKLREDLLGSSKKKK